MKKLFTTLTLVFMLGNAYAQAHLIAYFVSGAAAAFLPTYGEHGYLPGKKFKYYPALDHYDFGGQKLRVELYDNRGEARLKKIDCSEVEINNQSEYAGALGAQVFSEYLEKLLPEAGLNIDLNAPDTLKVYLEGLDSRLIGFGSVTAHGLCQAHIQLHHFNKTYCRDITDKDPHSPVGRNAFVTRLTATRIITSASIREVIEQFFIDLKTDKTILTQQGKN